MSTFSTPGSASVSQADELALSADWQSVLVHFDFHEGFAFGLLLVAGSTLAEACRADLERHLADSGKRLLDLSPASPDDLVDRCLSLPDVSAGPDVGCIWISAVVSEYQADFSEWEASFRNAFARLNPLRNVLQHRLPCTLLFVGAPWVQSVIRSMAPDLWSVRTLVTAISNVSLPTNSGVREDGPASSDAPDPDFALREAALLRGKPGDATALLRLLDRAGEGFMAQFRYEEASQALQEALDLRRSLDVPTIEIVRAELAVAAAFIEPGHYDAGMPHVQVALAALGELDSATTADELNAFDVAAELLLKVGRAEAAKELRERIVPIAESIFGPQDPTTLWYLANFAATLFQLGDFSRARSIEEGVVEVRTRLLGPEHPDTLIAVNNLASTLWRENDLAGARSLAEQVLGSRRRTLGSDHVNTLIAANNLATILAQSGDFAGALAIEAEVLAGLSRTVGPEHPNALIARENLALYRQGQGDLPGAQEELEHVVESKRRLFGSSHPSTIASIGLLASIYEAQGRTAEAAALLSEAEGSQGVPA